MDKYTIEQLFGKLAEEVRCEERKMSIELLDLIRPTIMVTPKEANCFPFAQDVFRFADRYGLFAIIGVEAKSGKNGTHNPYILMSFLYD